MPVRGNGFQTALPRAMVQHQLDTLVDIAPGYVIRRHTGRLSTATRCAAMRDRLTHELDRGQVCRPLARRLHSRGGVAGP